VGPLDRCLQLRDLRIVHVFLTQDCSAGGKRCVIGGWRHRPGTRNGRTAGPAQVPYTRGRADEASRLPPDRPSAPPTPSALAPVADRDGQTQAEGAPLVSSVPGDRFGPRYSRSSPGRTYFPETALSSQPGMAVSPEVYRQVRLYRGAFNCEQTSESDRCCRDSAHAMSPEAVA
jgi:hypothetical protein